MSEAAQTREAQQPLSLVDFLSGISSEVNSLDEEAEDALFQAGDRAEYAKLVQQRAQLVANLPQLLSDYERNGGEVPEDVTDWAASYGALAQGMIDNDNAFGMATLLTHRGSRDGDPTDLELLITKLTEDSAE